MSRVRELKRVLIANRGAVARRIVRTLRELGIESVVVYSDADKDLPYVNEADLSCSIGDSAPTHSYLNQALLLDVAARFGVDAIHPGYGFLAENAEFAQAVENADRCFIGPSPDLIRLLGHKTQARAIMLDHGLPMVRSSAVLGSDEVILKETARELGYPVLIKPAAGGGGIGMLPAHSDIELVKQWSRARSLAERSFSNADLYMEQLLESPRHIEFQFLADRYGNVRCLFERDCSSQRRHQKIIEEAPAPLLSRDLLSGMARQLEKVLAALRFDVIGTVEMLYTPTSGFVFLEVNTRLQVEHAVTEEVTGIDLVAAQLRLAAGEHLDDVITDNPQLQGHAIEARVYAEDPVRFFPSPGVLRVFRVPVLEGIRVETGYAEGTRVSSYYDPLVAKVVAYAKTRKQALTLLADALRQFKIEGIKTNIPFILQLLGNESFIHGDVSTDLVGHVLSSPREPLTA